MKILCVIDSLGSGGAQRQLVGLAKGFKQRGHEVSFLVYHDINFFKPQLDQANIKVNAVLEPNYLRRLLKMRQLIRGGGYDAVLSFLSASNFIAELAGLPHRKWRLIVGERNANPNMLKSPKLRFYRWLHFWATYIVSNSIENIKLVRHLNPLLPSEKFRVIYNLVDLEYWKPYEKTSPKKDNTTFRIIVLARHHRQKNLIGLIDAVNLLENIERESLVINWYGETFLDNVMSLAEQKIRRYGLEHVFRFHEPTTNVKDLILEADAVGMFSLYEGLPNTICEGMACGKPIIATAVSEVPALVQEGVNGFLCSPKDPQSIANAIHKAMKTSQENLNKMGQTSRRIAEKLFEPHKIIDQYLELLTK